MVGWYGMERGLGWDQGDLLMVVKDLYDDFEVGWFFVLLQGLQLVGNGLCIEIVWCVQFFLQLLVGGVYVQGCVVVGDIVLDQCGLCLFG